MAHRWFGLPRARPAAALAMLMGGILAGCASGGTPPVGAARPAVPRDAAVAAFNGWYEGRRTAAGPALTCTEGQRSVWFRVEDGIIEMRPQRRRRSAVAPLLAGTVSAGGELALRASDSDRLVGGRIAGGRLSATDIPGGIGTRRTRGPCGRSYDATFREPLRDREGSEGSSPDDR